MPDSKEVIRMQAQMKIMSEMIKASEDCVIILRLAVKNGALTPELKKRAEEELRRYDNYQKEFKSAHE